MLSRRASVVVVTAVAAALFGTYALAHSTSAWSRQARAVRAPVSSLSPAVHHSRDLRPGFGAILASDPGRSDRARPVFPNLPADDGALQRQMQQLLDTSAAAAKPPPPVINAPPLPPSAGGTCFVAAGGCSLVPCVELVQTSAVLQLNPPALSATTCLNHRSRGRGPLTLNRTEVVMDPITGTAVSIKSSPVSVVMNPSTGTVLSITPSQR